MSALSLPDHIELVSSISKSIRTNASELEGSTPGFYTNAVLRTPLADLIREADPSEVGLFTLVPPSSYGAGTAEEGEPSSATHVTRVDLPSATPLRPRTGREIKTQDHEPEVYANAALRFLDRYQSIQPMPRARAKTENILEQLATLRDSIENLVERVRQNEPTGSDGPAKNPHQLMQEETDKIGDLQTRITELRQRKAALAAKRAPFPKVNPPKFQPLEPAPPSPAPPAEEQQEHSFWNTPGPMERTANFGGSLLLDESVNLGDVSTSSFGTPLLAKGVTDLSDSPITQPRFTVQDDEIGDGNDVAPPSPLDGKAPEEPQEADVDTNSRSTPGRDRTPTPRAESEPQTPSRRQRIQITMETESIAAKIWATVGELIQPGYQHPGEGKTLRAKETISALRTLASKAPAPSSPTASSLSSFSAAPTPRDEPTVQQIQTAQLLLALLTAQPLCTLPMNRLKDIMTGNTGASGASHTRALYACVAKRLVKIERGKGEQSVKFDI